MNICQLLLLRYNDQNLQARGALYKVYHQQGDNAKKNYFLILLIYILRGFQHKHDSQQTQPRRFVN